MGKLTQAKIADEIAELQAELSWNWSPGERIAIVERLAQLGVTICHGESLPVARARVIVPEHEIPY